MLKQALSLQVELQQTRAAMQELQHKEHATSRNAKNNNNNNLNDHSFDHFVDYRVMGEFESHWLYGSTLSYDWSMNEYVLHSLTPKKNLSSSLLPQDHAQASRRIFKTRDY